MGGAGGWRLEAINCPQFADWRLDLINSSHHKHQQQQQQQHTWLMREGQGDRETGSERGRVDEEDREAGRQGQVETGVLHTTLRDFIMDLFNISCSIRLLQYTIYNIYNIQYK